jgi:hypothetical protein
MSYKELRIEAAGGMKVEAKVHSAAASIHLN